MMKSVTIKRLLFLKHSYVVLLYILVGVAIGMCLSQMLRRKTPVIYEQERGDSSECASCGQQSPKVAMTNESFWADVGARITLNGLYSETDDVETVLNMMRTSNITSVGIMEAGTSLKWIVVLTGGQKFIFKPQMIADPKYYTDCNLAFERPVYEIASFHIDRMLNIRKVPYSTGRVLDVRTDIMPVAEPTLKDFIFVAPNGTACFNFKCHFCAEPVEFCYTDGRIPGALIYHFSEKVHFFKGPISQYHPLHPYNAIINRNLKNDTICNSTRSFSAYSDLRMYMDIHDMNIFDYVIMHLDRKHHYIKLGDDNSYLLSVHVDHGLRSRRTTRDKLIRLRDMGDNCAAQFKNYTLSDVLYPLLSDEEFSAMERRIQDIIEIMDDCRRLVGDIAFVDA